MNSSSTRDIILAENKFDHAKRNKCFKNKDSKKEKWFRKSHKTDRTREQEKNVLVHRARRHHCNTMCDYLYDNYDDDDYEIHRDQGYYEIHRVQGYYDDYWGSFSEDFDWEYFPYADY